MRTLKIQTYFVQIRTCYESQALNSGTRGAQGPRFHSTAGRLICLPGFAPKHNIFSGKLFLSFFVACLTLEVKTARGKLKICAQDQSSDFSTKGPGSFMRAPAVGVCMRERERERERGESERERERERE